MSLSHVKLFVQLVLTLAILAFVPGNVLKMLLMAVVWLVTFLPVSRPESIFFALICAFFTFMNAMSLKQGIFVFSKPDLLLMPVYELLMWGFYTLHTKRLISGSPPEPTRTAWILALLYASAFGAIPDQQILFMVTGVLLIVGLVFFHDKLDFAYVGYMILLGLAVEITGVYSGEWYYPGDPIGGIPPWFITLWGGVGLFLRRLALPIIEKYDASIAARAKT